MIYRFLADAVLVMHLCFVLFVGLGGFLVLRWPRVAWLHLPVLAWGAWIEFSGWICPLTPLEVSLRERGGEAGYAGGFIDHYVNAWLYPGALTRSIQIAIGVTLFVSNTVIYGYAFHRARRARIGSADKGT